MQHRPAARLNHDALKLRDHPPNVREFLLRVLIDAHRLLLSPASRFQRGSMSAKRRNRKVYSSEGERTDIAAWPALCAICLALTAMCANSRSRVRGSGLM
jgi:hypothetical protein